MLAANQPTTAPARAAGPPPESARAHALFMQAPAIIFVLRGPEHIIELINPRAIELVGSRTAVGRPVREAFPEVEGQGFFELLDQVYRTGQPVSLNEMPAQLDRHGTGQREEAFVNFSYQPTRNTQGEVDGVLAHAVEVTEQVRARQQLEQEQARLREREAQLQTVVTTAPLGVLLIDDKLRVTAANPTVQQAWGSGQPLEGTDLETLTRQVWAAPLADTVLGMYRQVLASGEPVRVTQQRVPRADRGAIEYAEFQIHRMPLANGRHGLVCYFRDISTQVQAQQTGESKEAVLGGELAETLLLQRLSTQLLGPHSLADLYAQIAEAAAALMHSELSSLQILRPEREALELLATRGFDPAAAAHWQWVRATSDTTCGIALRTRRRFIAPEAATLEAVSGVEDWVHYHRLGICAVQSTPLVSRAGQVVGMLSTHWQKAHRPSARSLQLLDVLARQAADLIEHKLNEEALEAHAAQLEAHAAQLEAHVAARTSELRRLAAYMEQLREEERTRMAREIHDELGQQLTGLKLDVAALKARAGDAEALRTMLAGVTTAIDETIHTVRRLAGELRPSILDDLGLVAALEAQLAEFQRRSGLRYSLDAVVDEARLSADTRTALFRVFQETLTNVARHAHASKVSVRLEETDHTLRLEVQDNGQGITAAQRSGTGSLGLLGMRERVRLLAGELTLDGAPGQGTTVCVTIPLKPTAAE